MRSGRPNVGHDLDTPMGEVPDNTEEIELTILMPCLNEALTIATCIEKANKFLQKGISGEVVISDNGSEDGSQEIARRHGARVIFASRRGYGAAIRSGISASRGKFVIVGDCDDSYDFSNLQPFVDSLRNGADLVIGNRFIGGIDRGAMPWLHRWIGNPILSYLGRLFFKAPVGDFHCGLRGAVRRKIVDLDVCSPGMEFATEMIAKAALAGLKIQEVPTRLSKDGRDRPPHLRTWRDGWRHLRFMLTLSPNWLYLVPGASMFIFGMAVMVITAILGRVELGSVALGLHTMFYGAEIAIIGWQLLIFFLIVRVLGAKTGVLPRERNIPEISIESGIVVGVILASAGIAISSYFFGEWLAIGMGALNPLETMRWIIPASVITITGFELIFAAFVLQFVRQLRPYPC